MPRLYLIRHARPSASWGEDPDPGLDALGQTQARATAQALASSHALVPIYTSPLRRCRETAAPLSELWDCTIQSFPPVAEIPSPPIELAARREWLGAAMQGTWARLHATAPDGSIDYLVWRRALVDSLIAMPRDCVIFTHFIAINVAVGAATSSEQVVCFRPDHASVTAIDATAGRLSVFELGREAATSILTGR
ncbi:MAG: histidine phosphatase family protein [Steroidobacter sp.]